MGPGLMALSARLHRALCGIRMPRQALSADAPALAGLAARRDARMPLSLIAGVALVVGSRDQADIRVERKALVKKLARHRES